MDELLAVVTSRPFITGALSAIGGALFWNFVALHRGRVRYLEYSIDHTRVGVSAQDAVFGNVAMSWQGQPVQNLHLSTVTLENGTSTNFSNLPVKVFTGNPTFLLNEQVWIPGTTYRPSYTTAFQNLIAVPHGVAAPGEIQHEIYWHSREYNVPVLNQRQKVIFTFLATVPDGGEPRVWLDIQQPGVTATFVEPVPRVFGVPSRWALGLGWIASLLILLAAAASPYLNTWGVALVCLVAGLAVQGIGAMLYRTGRFIHRVIFH